MTRRGLQPSLPSAPRGAGGPCVANGRLRHRLIGYARVSKTDGSQSLDLQRDALRAAGVDDAVNLYHDLASGVRDDRPGLDKPVILHPLVDDGGCLVGSGQLPRDSSQRGPLPLAGQDMLGWSHVAQGTTRRRRLPHPGGSESANRLSRRTEARRPTWRGLLWTITLKWVFTTTRRLKAG